MELSTARSVLGVTASDEWDTVKRAYRDLIRGVHPDIAGAGGVDSSVRLNDAYRTLSLARREGRLGTVEPDPSRPDRSGPDRSGPRPAPEAMTGVGVPADLRIVGGDTLVMSSTPGETFRRLVEGVNALGEISYVDRSSSIFEAVLRLEDGTPASFVVSLQWRAHDATCEAFCTLEALDRAEHLDVGGVLEQLAPHIPPDVGD